MEYISSLDKVYSLPKKRNISILGCTGSIGISTLEVIEKKRNIFSVSALGAGENIYKLAEQAIKFRPKYLCVKYEDLIKPLKEFLPQDYRPQILTGIDGYNTLATLEEAHIIILAISGAAGLRPIVKAVEKGKVVALANKESLVLAGPIIKKLCKKTGAAILPIDSEHNAIFQVIAGRDIGEVNKIILTASGGPFFGKDKGFLKNVTKEMALKHPNWSMGPKITIDSATLMNKGLEVIEAYYLFGVHLDKIEVAIHRESIIHSMVEFCDGSIIAQMGLPDMKLPIAYCLSYPNRINFNWEKLDIFDIGTLSFFKPDTKLFPMLKLAQMALEAGQSYVVALNAANEIAVEAFLSGKLKFLDIVELNKMVLDRHTSSTVSTLEDILEIDAYTRELAVKLIKELETK